MAGKRDAHERLPELISAAVRVFTREGYRLARMSDVAAEMGLSEAAIYRYVGSKEGLFVLAIRHALLLEDLPAGDLPLSPAPLAATLREARDFIAEVVPFGALAEALAGQRAAVIPRPSSRRSSASCSSSNRGPGKPRTCSSARPGNCPRWPTC